ncbi:MAG: hypothetical protein ACYDET_09770, partial [Thermoleophilia bacterium]
VRMRFLFECRFLGHNLIFVVNNHLHRVLVQATVPAPRAGACYRAMPATIPMPASANALNR